MSTATAQLRARVERQREEALAMSRANQQSFENLRRNQRRMNLAKQLRSESPAVFPCIHDEMLPVTDDRSPFVVLRDVPEDVRRGAGRQVFERVVNYLRLLAMKGLFPHRSLLDQVLVRFDDQSRRVLSINLSPTFLSTLPQPLAQIKELQEHLGQRDALPESDRALDYYFPPSQESLGGQLELEDVACLVDNVGDIDLVNNIGMQFVCAGQLLSAEDLLRLLGSQLDEPGDGSPLWLLLARFCAEHRAVGRLGAVPAWLSEYVQYQNARPLPALFTDNAMTAQPLEMLRMCLGMYPSDLGIAAELPGNLNAHLRALPVWYQQRVYQIFFHANDFVIGAFRPNGVVISLGDSAQDLKALCDSYE